MANYSFPRTKKILVIVLKNSAFDSADEVKALKETFEQLADSEVRILESDKVDLNKQLAEEQFSEFNIFMLYVLSDFQAGFRVSTFTHSTSLDIGLLSQAVANNASLLGYPKVLVFVSKVTDDGEKDKGHLSSENHSAGHATGEPGQSLANKELSGNVQYFWDIFVAKIVTGLNPSTGFIPKLCQEIENTSSSEDFVQIITKVIKNSQLPKWQYLNQLGKELFLHQGNNLWKFVKINC